MKDAKRCIFLTGAPRRDVLHWDDERLNSSFDASVQRFLDTPDNSNEQHMPQPSFGEYSKWRSVACNDSISRSPTKYPGPTKDKSTTSHNVLNGRERLEDFDFDFVEHSIAVLEDLDITQIIGAAAGDPDETSLLDVTDLSFPATTVTDTSTLTTNDSFATASPTQEDGDPVTVKILGGITDLRSLPKADHITRIWPSTMTKNLLVGVIAISPSRTVYVRRRDTYMDIIELTVGDETRAGFGINFWLTPLESQKHPDEHREQLRPLRSGHVVLLQNVALTCWNGHVYGQSLSKRFARNTTTITVLEDASQHSLSTPVVSKLRRVRDWTTDFVGVGESFPSREVVGGSAKKRKIDELPPDTQD